MPAISTCPKCRRQVSIPRGVDAAAAVRCPLCDAAYALSEALALAPPELIPIGYATDADNADRSAVEPLIAVESGTETETESEEDAIVSPPHIHIAEEDVDEEDRENEAAAVATGLPATSVSAHLRKRPSRSAWRTMLEVVTGGLAGCLAAYYGLALWFGPDLEKHLPKLPLPFIAHLTAPPAANPPAAQPPLKKPSRP